MEDLKKSKGIDFEYSVCVQECMCERKTGDCIEYINQILFRLL